MIDVDNDGNHQLNVLRTNVVPNKLGNNNIKRYSLTWDEGGVNVTSNDEHQKYIKRFVDDFVDNIKLQIQEAWRLDESKKMSDLSHVVTKNADANLSHAERRKTISVNKTPKPVQAMPSTRVTKKHQHAKVLSNAKKKIFAKTSKIDDVLSGNVATLWSSDEDVVVENVVDLWVTRFALKKEVLHHLHFCKKKCDVFCGRENELDEVRMLILSNERTKPIVVTAPSGAGKTAFMAMIAKQTKEWLGPNCSTIIRFLGTTPTSSTIQQVLQSICEQISDIYCETIPGHVDRMNDLVSKGSTINCLIIKYVYRNYFKLHVMLRFKTKCTDVPSYLLILQNEKVTMNSNNYHVKNIILSTNC